jgi:hypothetical protein
VLDIVEENKKVEAFSCHEVTGTCVSVQLLLRRNQVEEKRQKRKHVPILHRVSKLKTYTVLIDKLKKLSKLYLITFYTEQFYVKS